MAAPCLALVPGLNNTAQVWDGAMASLAGAADCRALDCPALDTVEAVADALLAQLPQRFFLAGFSFGGYVALAQYFEEDVIARVKIPCLCIAGELDTTCPSVVMQKMATLSGGEFHEMMGVGHYGWGERPDEYHAKVLDFLHRRVPA